MDRCLTLGVLVVLVACALAQIPSRRLPPKKKVPEVDQTCMECICQASSNCDQSLKCHNSGGGGYFCGPYVISWAYWYDGGRPGDKGREHDFETCLSNKTCAEQAVRGYMRKYGQDCDGSGAIDCYDFARIHKLGFGSCGGDAIYDSDYWEKFETCYYGPPADEHGYNNAGFPEFPGNTGNNNEEPVNYDYGEGSLQARKVRN